MNTLHITAGPDNEMILESIVNALRQSKKDDQHIVMCRPGSLVEEYCVENEIVSFAIGGNILSLLQDSGLLKRIAKNYSIDNVRIYDKKGNRIAKFAQMSGRR